MAQVGGKVSMLVSVVNPPVMISPAIGKGKLREHLKKKRDYLGFYKNFHFLSVF